MAHKHVSNWIWASGENAKDQDSPFVVLFRKKVVLAAEPAESRIAVSADSRYKLYINDELVEIGPSKGDHQVWFLDEMDIRPYLRCGDNIIAAEVLRFPANPFAGNQSVMVTSFPGFYLTGTCIDKNGRRYDLAADTSWTAKTDFRIEILAESQDFAPLHFFERVHGDEQLSGWKQTDFDDSTWESAVLYPNNRIRKNVSPGNLTKRTIPFLYRKKRNFMKIMQIVKSDTDISEWERFIQEKSEVLIQPGTQEIVEIDAGEEMTGYLKLVISGGKDAEIEILQSEAYVQNRSSHDSSDATAVCIKKDRLDTKNGHLEGYSDFYYPHGKSSKNKFESYEPFWFRTFRFIRLIVTTKEEPVTLHSFHYTETGYPLQIRSEVQTSDTSLKEIWDISARTLRRCMHETYEDCPFYEQLQYVMDSRSQILYTYASAYDDRLARKCMDDFRRSQRYDGLLCSAYPNTKPNVIPGFAIYYILMLHDHMMYFGDKSLIYQHIPVVENILYYFVQNLTEKGYVGKIGDIHGQERFWSFIDWVPQWISGVPGAVNSGSITMESLLYLLGLEAAEELMAYIGRKEQASAYRKMAVDLKLSIRLYCIGRNGMIKDGPDCEEYSQHCQVFGILTGVLTPLEGRKNLLETIKHKEIYAQCTVSMALYLFRALEKTGLYKYTDDYWDIWRRMLENHMTTCAESEAYPRSECHAWGALALYELPSAVLGVRPAVPGFKKVLIHPTPGCLAWAKGKVVTPKGMVFVSWEKQGDGIRLEYQVPEGMEVQKIEEKDYE